MEHHFVRELWRIELNPLMPVVAQCVREDAGIPIEPRGRDGAARGGKGPTSATFFDVPEGELSGRSGSSADIVLERVKGYGVDGEHVPFSTL
jgi:hypothetical protein